MLLSKRPERFLPNYWPTYYGKAKDCFVWDMDTGLVLVDVVLEDSSDILPLSNKALAGWRSQEFLIKLLELHHFLGVGPSLKRGLEVSDWSGVLDSLSSHVDISGLLLDGSLAGLRNFDLKGVDGSLGLLKFDVSGGDDTEEKCDGEVLHFESGGF